MILNKFSKYSSLLVVGIFYVILLILDDYAVLNSTKSHLNNKIEGFRNGDQKAHLILGGSNAYYSLSAEQLNNSKDMSWYNLSLSGEGYKNTNYYEFLKNNFSSKERMGIQKILYSSIYYYRKGSIALRKNSSKSIYGLKKNSIKPAFSGFTYLKRYITRGSILTTYPSQNNFGDIIFNPNLCASANIKEAYDIEDYKIIHDDILEKNRELKVIFPNAEIYFIFPSDFIDKKNIHLFRDDLNNLKQSIDENLTLKKINNNIIFQEPYSVNDLCDTPSHSNSLGRIKRTNEIITKLNL